jgi:hypothetical protein
MSEALRQIRLARLRADNRAALGQAATPVKPAALAPAQVELNDQDRAVVAPWGLQAGTKKRPLSAEPRNVTRWAASHGQAR